MLTLEQELEAVIASSDYRVRLAMTGCLHVHVHYMPSIRTIDGSGRVPICIADGDIGYKLFSGPPRWRYWRARRFVRATIAGHRKLLAEGVRPA